MSALTSNQPPLASSNCGTQTSQTYQQACGNTGTSFGDVFSDQSLFKLERSDDLCSAYEKINKNFKMMAEGYLMLAQALTVREQVTFGSTTPGYYEGPFHFNIANGKLFVWHGEQSRYIPAYGTNSTDEQGEPTASPYTPSNTVPSLANLRNVCDGVAANAFTNMYGAQEVVFVGSEPTCNVGLFIFDRNASVMKIWSPADDKYIPSYGCGSKIDPNCSQATSDGSVTGVVSVQK